LGLKIAHKNFIGYFLIVIDLPDRPLSQIPLELELAF